MPNQALFIFEGTLKDFLSSSEKTVAFDFLGNPSVKDAIEAQGVPHVEVTEILINQNPVPLSYKLQSGDEIQVYPYSPKHWSSILKNPIKFIVDGHLGKLAKALRTLGFDSIYDKDYQEQTIANISQNENRFILTRSLHLLKLNKVEWGYWIRSQEPGEQIEEVLNYFALRNQIQAFTRCRICNGLIEPVNKDKIIDQLPPLIKANFDEYFQCKNCQKVYWKGSHYEKMEAFVRSIKG